MRLLNRITVWFTVVFILITPFTMYLSFSNIRKNLDNAEIARLTSVNNVVGGLLSAGQTVPTNVKGLPVTITEVQGPIPNKPTVATEQCAKASHWGNDCKLTLSSYYQVGGHNYKVSSFNYISKSKDIVSGMLNAVAWKLILFVLAMILAARILSKRMFAPFHKTIDILRNFNLKNREKIDLPNTSITEFRELHIFLKKMTDKAVEDYSALKEFSENASHELQTPLAVIRNKLELLSESSINESQATLILDMHNAIEKLSRINRSLILLTKMENQEFEVKESLNICTVAREVLANFADRITLREISVTSNIDKGVALRIHPALADILVNNLISNAVRHNVDGGTINIHLTSEALIVRNTGLPLAVPADDLFLRFKKSDQCADSIGLGLALVKQVCDVNGFKVTYQNEGDKHTISVLFNARAVAASRVPVGRVAEPVI